MNADDTVSSDEPSTPTRGKRSRIVPLLLIAGVVLSAAPLMKRLPHEHKIDFRFDEGANDVTRLDVDWVRFEGDVETEIVGGSSRSFERGQAPENVNITVHLPNGLYALDIRVEHPDRIDAIRRRVTLGESDRIVIPLRAERVRP